jgi:hypothetical protein
VSTTPRCVQCGAEVNHVLRDGQGVDLSGIGLQTNGPAPMAPPLLSPCGHRSDYTMDANAEVVVMPHVSDVIAELQELCDGLAVALRLTLSDPMEPTRIAVARGALEAYATLRGADAKVQPS